MTLLSQETVSDLLVRNIPRDLVMGVEDALTVGAQRAFDGAGEMDRGHRAHVIGQLRHFEMNEAYYRALKVGGANPKPLHGNNVVTGRAGVFTLGRFNIEEGFWIKGRRSKTRKQMALANMAIEPLVQPGLFNSYTPPTDAVAFFVACFSGSLSFQPEKPISIYIAVPDREMKGWLFREPLSMFLDRYDTMPAMQDDRAIPTLKSGVVKHAKDGTEK